MAAVWRRTTVTAGRCLRRPRRWPACRSSGWPSSRRLHSTSGESVPWRNLLYVAEEVADALATNRPVVALESTIYTHGAMGVDLALEARVRAHGAVPAVVGILDGRPCVGLTPAEIDRMVHEGAQKASRRDLAFLVGLHGRQQQGQRTDDRGDPMPPRHGGTTVSGTMVLARLAGIRVFGTGGLGGVHRGWASHLDISADLRELGRTRVAVVSSGCKGFLDVPATLEYLETQGVHVSTFADGRGRGGDGGGSGGGGVDFPAFWARDSGVPSPAVIPDEAAAAAVILAQEKLGIETGLLFANPIPAAAAIPRAEMARVIDQAVDEAAAQGFTGARNTPFVLRRIRELTGDRSVQANVALVQANVVRAAKVAVALSALMTEDDSSTSASFPVVTSKGDSSTKTAPNEVETRPPTQTDILVAGSVALDLSCDYLGGGSDDVSPQLHTSNPAAITPTVGGVGHNVALAAHRISPALRVKLCSMVGEDLAGATVLAAMQSNGLDTALVHKARPGHRTAQYVAVNGADKNLMVAMADMALFEDPAAAAACVEATSEAVEKATTTATTAAPSWLVVDANWQPAILRRWLAASRQMGARVAFESVSVAKAARLFPPRRTAYEQEESQVANAFPGGLPLVDLATPNADELAALHAAARNHGYLTDHPPWFATINALGLTGGASAYLLVRAPPSSEAEEDGSNDAAAAAAVGGVYMRLFPPAETAAAADVVSVNGVGDTFMGALVAGLAQGGRVEQLVDVAQRAAVRTLQSRESVSADLGSLAGALTDAAAAAAASAAPPQKRRTI
ncbi:indigoidine synthase a-like protein [Niveomyces insectorum RCEF 264]|uniref:Indigoidine synthase a-like protein n=1 Tax=Niveomyces insectorum RCEF 264 TaxID=1081102 RepID=A0A167U362_9HYPO|nr:indigoidine synthase a-like protein [Niveomyces insectorum RCEF 264]